jgi:hypothetical protein
MFSNFVDLWIPIMGTQKDEKFNAFCFHDYPSDMLLDQCEKCPQKHTHTLTKVKTLFTLNISTTQYKIIFLHQLANTLHSARKDCIH